MILYEDEVNEKKFKKKDDEIRELWERIDLIEKRVDEINVVLKRLLNRNC